MIENPKASHAGLARGLWLVYTAATILASLLILAIYVNAYDDHGLTERLRAVGGFTRRAARIISFPLGLPLGAMANPLFERIFGCEEPNEPCGAFTDWWTHFAALLVKVFIFRWFVRRSSGESAATRDLDRGT
jgi:hypothetical protein